MRGWRREPDERSPIFPPIARNSPRIGGNRRVFLGRLPQKPYRSPSERAGAGLIQDRSRDVRARFLSRHADSVYDAVTARRSRFVRVEELVIRVADVVPGLLPTAQELAAEDGLIQRDRSGVEIDQGLFLSAVLRNESCGRHLCHAMLLPRAEAQALLPQFEREGRVELSGASVHRKRQGGPWSRRTILDFSTPKIRLRSMARRVCVDLALLDRASEVAVMRGAVVEHPKYKGRRVFGAGINLTHLYHGRIPFVWYLQRDLGYVNKIYRGTCLRRRCAARRVRRQYHRETLDRRGSSPSPSAATAKSCW